MKVLRLLSLTAVLVCVLGLPALTAQGQSQSNAQSAPPAASPKPAPQNPAAGGTPAPAQQSNPQPNQANPFEAVPQAAPQTAPQQPGTKPPFEAPPTAPSQQPKLAAANQTVVEAVEFRGSRRVPQDTLRALIVTRRGDFYSEDTLRRDFQALWNTGRFDDIRLETEPSAGGIIVRFVVTERPVIRTIKYEGAKSVTVSEILDRFKERKVGLSVESQYDPNKVQRAAVVLKELLAERGRQFAKVEPDIRRIPPSSLEVIFNVDEGPKVKVGNINIVGNKVFTQKEVIRAMHNLHPIGIPYSIWFENLFSRTFDKSKLEEDQERVRDAYQQKGYWMAKVFEPTVKLRDTGGANGGTRIKFIKPNKPGKAADVTLPVEEGAQFRLHVINYVGVKLFRTPELLSRTFFGMDAGDVFSTAKLRKGLENMRKAYGDFGYIDFVPEPEIEPVPGTNTIDLTLTADEGKQFFIRRIDFSGNTTTRDKVIRREILLNEGDLFSQRLWDASILRLNQLGYFEILKENEAYTLNRNPQSNTVDVTLKVKEKGKNSIGLNGGVSGIAGDFLGFNYSTNNFLGLGDTLTLEAQLGTRMRSVNLGFTEPHVMDTDLTLGFVVYIRQFNYDQGREYSILTGENLTSYYNALGSANILNYTQDSKGFTFSASYPIKRSFARWGVSYGFDNSSIKAKSTGATTYFTYINFEGVSGPNSLQGIKTSHIVPSYSYNSKNHPLNPTRGKSLFISTEFAASFLGGNVNTIKPTVDFQYYHSSPKWTRNTFAFHLLGSFLTGYGGKDAPPFARAYIGGEQDIRGFDFYSVSPIAFIASEANIAVLDNNGNQIQQKIIVNGQPQLVGSSINVPMYQLITPGGDTQVVSNTEYRIPIIGPVTLAPFMDIGENKVSRTDQLTMNQDRVNQLNALFPQAGFTDKVIIAKDTEHMRMSTGLEIQVMLPVVNAPFRIYYAFNPLLVREYIQPPIVADRTFFNNQQTFNSFLNTYGTSYPFFEKRGTFRFTIGRTF
jgi:outer membrane protein insertion porin family